MQEDEIPGVALSLNLLSTQTMVTTGIFPCKEKFPWQNRESNPGPRDQQSETLTTRPQGWPQSVSIFNHFPLLLSLWSFTHICCSVTEHGSFTVTLCEFTRNSDVAFAAQVCAVAKLWTQRYIVGISAQFLNCVVSVGLLGLSVDWVIWLMLLCFDLNQKGVWFHFRSEHQLLSLVSCCFPRSLQERQGKCIKLVAVDPQS